VVLAGNYWRRGGDVLDARSGDERAGGVDFPAESADELSVQGQPPLTGNGVCVEQQPPVCDFSPAAGKASPTPSSWDKSFFASAKQPTRQRSSRCLVASATAPMRDGTTYTPYTKRRDGEVGGCVNNNSLLRNVSGDEKRHGVI